MTKVVVVVMVVMEIVMVVMEVVFSFTKSALVHSNLNISSPPIPAEIILYQTFLPSCNNFRPKLTNNSQSSSLGRLCWSCWCSSKQLVASWIWRRWWQWCLQFSDHNLPSSWCILSCSHPRCTQRFPDGCCSWCSARNSWSGVRIRIKMRKNFWTGGWWFDSNYPPSKGLPNLFDQTLMSKTWHWQ